MPVRKAIICIDKGFLLEWLQFEGGQIHEISADERCLFLEIEHPDLPETDNEKFLPEINPEYTTSYHKTVERTYPLKGQSNAST